MRTGKAPSVLMLSPTRELAMQIAAVMEEAGSRAGLTTICTYGGVPKHTQASALRKGVHIIVATPGRLKVGDVVNGLGPEKHTRCVSVGRI